MASGPEHAKHLPGQCRVCWKPCFNRPETGFHCNDCLPMLATHHNVRVRQALAGEAGVPTSILELLSSDMEAAVSTVATQRLLHAAEDDADDIWDDDF